MDVGSAVGDAAAADVGVRRARAADVPAMAGVMARAFADDPLMRWVLPDDDTRVARMERWFAAVYRQVSLEHLVVYTSDPVHGVAEWAPPGGWRLRRRDALPSIPATIRWLRSGTFRISTAMAALADQHPSEPHWYLGGLGTDPAFQGRGVATALLQPVLDRCDDSGTPAYLETQKEANLPFYARHGFAVVGQLDVPGGGPHIWRMWRDPSSPPAAPT